jgi:hypothetical protein
VIETVIMLCPPPVWVILLWLIIIAQYSSAALVQSSDLQQEKYYICTVWNVSRGECHRQHSYQSRVILWDTTMKEPLHITGNILPYYDNIRLSFNPETGEEIWKPDGMVSGVWNTPR